MNTVYNCLVCQKPLKGKQRSFCSISCKNDYYLNYKSLKKRANEKKRVLISRLGGKCERCGYTLPDALSFYTPGGKSLGIDTNILGNCNLDGIKDRLVGAKIYCRNCVASKENLRINPTADKHIRFDITGFMFDLGKYLSPEQPAVVLGVSGGVDSMVMMDLFANNYPKEKTIVAHINHAFRPEADGDEKFVNKRCQKLGLKFVSTKLKLRKRGNQEEYFRDERRRFLTETAKKHSAKYIVLAHNMNDQAETVLMNLVRGSGSNGLGGMDIQEGAILRPLLTYSRSEIEYYAKQSKLTWREDQTNADTSYSRNYLRHEVLPLLAKLNSEYLANISRSAEIQRDISGYITGQSKGAKLSSSLPRPVLYELLAQKYEQVKGDRQNLSLKNLRDLQKLIENPSGTKSISLQGGISAVRTYDNLDFCAEKEDNGTSTLGVFPLEKLHEINPDFSIKTEPYDGSKLDNWSLVIDSKEKDQLSARYYISGDKIAKRGITGNKKLQDLFVDAKISRERRKSWPVVVSKSGEILWVPGLAMSRKMPENPKNPILIKVSEVNNESSEE